MGTIRDAALEIFREETAELFIDLEQGLLRLEKEPEALAETVDALFRAAHTLKGSAALMKLTSVSTLAHLLEDSLEHLRESRKRPHRTAVDAYLFTVDRLREMARKREGDQDVQTLLEEAQARLGAVEEAANNAPDEPAVTPVRQEVPAYAGPERRQMRGANEDAAGGVRVATEKIEGMMTVLGQLTVTQTHLSRQASTVDQMKEEIAFAGQRLLREAGRFSDRYAYAMPQARPGDVLTADFQELEFDRYDEINLFARTLQEITNDINEALRTLGDFFGRFFGEMQTMDALVREMKEKVSEVRTIQARFLFQRFTRTVRELSLQTGRQLELRVSGGETPLDRAIYDGLYDPLLHIVRNAVAHGLEPEEERLAKGKPAVGHIVLSASRRGNTVEIEVRDDGRGIQFDKIRRRGIEMGLLRPEEVVPEKDLLNLIFRPGFSTTATTDEISGRGVGMNVVMDRLAALNGTIDIQASPGGGTVVRLTVPLSLVIVNVVQFSISEQIFVIPANLVAEIVLLEEDQVRAGWMELREEKIPLIDLGTLFGLSAGEGRSRFAIVTQSSGRRIALLVDAILSQEDAVIRPFETLLREMPHLSGTSLAGDGSLRLVLNPARLLGVEKETGVAPLMSETPAAVERSQTVVLVVDDSLSVRKYAAMTLEAGGVEVLTAANGLEALEVLDSHAVDVVITDLEMPLMHGYALLGELGRRGLLESLPVAVLSSRAGDQHRDKAFGLGARDYLVKPFEEETLMETVRRLAGRP